MQQEQPDFPSNWSEEGWHAFWMGADSSASMSTLHVIVGLANQDYAKVYNYLYRPDVDLGAITADGKTVLHVALNANCDGEMIRELVELGAPLDIRTPDGLSPCDLATAQGKHRLAAHMRQVGADRNQSREQ